MCKSFPRNHSKIQKKSRRKQKRMDAGNEGGYDGAGTEPRRFGRGGVDATAWRNSLEPRLPEALRAETRRKMFPSIQKKILVARKNKKLENIFSAGLASEASGGAIRGAYTAVQS